MAAKCPSRGAAGTPRFGRRGEAPPSLSGRWSNAWCSQVKVVRGNVNDRSCVYACGLRSSAGTSWFTFAQRGLWVNTTLCRTHGLKSGACRRPETERQGLPMRPSHDSVRRSESSLHTMDRPSSSIRLSGPPGVVTCASSLRCELHSRLQSPRVTAGDLSNTFPRDTNSKQQTPKSHSWSTWRRWLSVLCARAYKKAYVLRCSTWWLTPAAPQTCSLGRRATFFFFQAVSGRAGTSRRLAARQDERQKPTVVRRDGCLLLA